MSIQSLILKNRRLATWFMSSRPSSFWEKSGEKKALKKFRIAAGRVPAYQKFLKENNIDPEKIKTIENFKKLPILEKKNYLQKYGIEELCLDGKLSDKYMIDRSSGYSDVASYWPRLAAEDQDYPLYMKLAYEQFYQIDKKSTLMVITLALGSWVGGEKISWATREIAINGKNPFTVITPGLNLEEIIDIIRFFKGKYEQIVLVGYPPFIKGIIDEGEKQGLDWKEVHLKIGLGAEGYSEDWREYIKGKIGLPENDLMGVAGGYGAADLGMSVGREYPISVLIRKLAQQDKSFAKDLFNAENLPSLCQYNPAAFYIEELNEELIFSCLAGIPLIRYNIHDRGGVIPFEKAMKIAKSHGLNPIDLLKEKGYTEKDIWKLPFFYVFGRSDGTAIIDGTNVYPENVEQLLYTKEGELINSFKLGTEMDNNFNENLIISLELKKNKVFATAEELDDFKKRVHDVILKKMLELNPDYKDAFQHHPRVCDPKINIYEYRKGPFSSDSDKIKLNYILKKGA
jgi:phenylacetate-CoA ligase